MTALEHLVFLVLVSILQAGGTIETNGPEIFHTVNTGGPSGAVKHYCVHSGNQYAQQGVNRAMVDTGSRYNDVRYVMVLDGADVGYCLEAEKPGALNRDGDTWRFFDDKEQLMIATMVEQSGFGTWDIPWETGYHLTLPLPAPPTGE